MLSLTPMPTELVSYYNDSEDTRHFCFRLLDPEAIKKTQPGQFFMLHIPGIGAAPFTFTTPPDSRGVFYALIKSVGKVTRALFNQQAGTTLGVRGPFGTGWPIKTLAGQRILIVAGGCGIAPLVNLTETLLQQNSYQSLALLYGAGSQKTEMLKAQRLRWQQQMPMYTVLETPGQSELTGTPVDVLDTVLGQLGEFPTALLLCGPEIMMQKMAGKFIDKGLAESSIWLSIERRMHCAVGLCGHCYLHHSYGCADGPTYRWDHYQQLSAGDTDPGLVIPSQI